MGNGNANGNPFWVSMRPIRLTDTTTDAVTRTHSIVPDLFIIILPCVIAIAIHPLHGTLHRTTNPKRRVRERQRKQRRNPKSSYDLLRDRVVMAAPKLFLTFFTIIILKRCLPEASQKSIGLLASAVSDSLRFRSLSIYALRLYAAAIDIRWIAF